MEHSRSEGWTRRRLSLLAGGAISTLTGLMSSAGAEAGKHPRRKKRCTKSAKSCGQGKQRCCSSLTCGEIDGRSGRRCCRKEGTRCGGDGECCGLLYCGTTGSGPDVCLLPSSDRNRKANFGSVDPVDMLQRVSGLPITSWNYRGDDPTVRHIGPMAQDFAAIFGVGADDRHIHPIDGQGVALAAIQGLIFDLDRLQAEGAALRARLSALERPQRQPAN